jgi:hypothetical protein
MCELRILSDSIRSKGFGSSSVELSVFLIANGAGCALGSTQPLKMSTRKTPGGKDGRCARVTTLPPS